MTEEERKHLNSLIVEVLILRFVVLELCRTVFEDGGRDRLAALFTKIFPDSPGDPEEIDKLEEFARATSRFLSDVQGVDET